MIVERNPKISAALTHEHSTGTSFPPQGPDDPGDKDPHNNKERKIPIWARVTATLAGFALVGSGAALVVANNNHENNDAKAVATAPSNPGTEKTPTPEDQAQPELTVASVEFNPNASPEELGTDFEDTFTSWMMAGATQENAELSLKSDLNSADFAGQIAEKNAQIYGEALFGPDWVKNPSSAYTVDFMMKQNKVAITMFIASADQKEPFTYKNTVSESKVLSANADNSEFTVEVTSTLTNNSEENRAGKLIPDLLGQNSESVADVTFIKNDSHVYIKDFNYKD